MAPLYTYLLIFLSVFGGAILRAQDVDLMVGASTPLTTSLTYTWSLASKPGTYVPTITPNQPLPVPAGGVTNRAKATFVNADATPGVYGFKVDITDTLGRVTTDTTTVTVNASQVITFPSIPAKVVGDAAFTVTPTSNKGTTGFAFVSDNTAVATVNATSGQVTIVGAGTVKITATQAGVPASFIAPGSGFVTLTIGKGTPTLTFNDGASVAKNLGTPDFVLGTATNAVPGLALTWTSSVPGVATINSTTGSIHLVATGTTTIRATITGNANFNTVFKEITLTVNAATVTPTLTFSPVGPITIAFGDAPLTITASLSPISGQTITYTSLDTTVATISPTTGLVTLIDPGSVAKTVQIKASVAATTGFAAASATVQLTVQPKRPVVLLRAQASPNVLSLP